MSGTKASTCSLICLLVLLFGLANGYNYWEWKREEVKPGKCPMYTSQSNFLTQNFVGTWYVSHQFQSYEHRRFLDCQELTFTSVPGNNFSLSIKGLARGTRNLSIRTAGESVVADHRTPAVMRWSWDYFPSMVDYVSVLYTDYLNYAIIVLCQDFGLFHAVYPILMTREVQTNVTNNYITYFNKAQKLFPFPVFDSWGEPNTCYLKREYPDEDVNVLNIDDLMGDITSFIKKFA